MVIVTTLVVYSRRTNPSPSAPILRGSILSIRNRHFSSFWSPAINHLGSSHVVQVLHGQEVHVEESIDAVGQAALLASIELGVLDAASDALVPADLGQAMCFCSPIVSAQASGYHHRWGGGGDSLRDWICDRCCSLARNWRRSPLSLSLSLSRSAFSSWVEAFMVAAVMGASGEGTDSGDWKLDTSPCRDFRTLTIGN